MAIPSELKAHPPALILPAGGEVVYSDGTERACQNCIYWGQAESGDWGACCRLSYSNGVVTVGDGVLRTPPEFGCNEFAPRPKEVLVLEGILHWCYEDIRIGGVNLGVAFGKKWPDDRGDSGLRYRWTIERLEGVPTTR